MAYSSITKPSDYFNTVLYVGNGTAIGSGGKTVTGVGFQPDFVWGKARSGTDAVDNHELTDAVRGATKYLKCNTTSAETTNTESLTSFTNDGFTLGSNGQLNRNGNNCVAWNWKANGAGSANTAGSINSTVSVSTTSGFSIVKYTGTGSQATVGHGLGVAPKMIIVKRLQNAEDWAVYHASNGAGTYQSLNTTEAKQTNSNRFNVAPTSSVFTVNTHESVNFAENYIAYCFADKKGYSKFGSYTGNGNANGTFVYTGFKPAFVIYKGAVGANAVDNWEMADNKRSPFNGIENVLYPNQNYAEGTGVTTRMDFLSNGFKMRTSGTDYNGSGQTYIYMAFAEQPLVANSGTDGVPATAR